MTTIELKEKKNHEDETVRHRFEVAHIKYDNGYWANVRSAMGQPLMWLIPIQATLDEDGTFSTGYVQTHKAL